MAFIRRARHVREHVEPADAVIAAEHFDQRVCIRQRSRLVAKHDQHVLSGLRELQHPRRDAGGGVDDQHIEP